MQNVVLARSEILTAVSLMIQGTNTLHNVTVYHATQPNV
jgi:hypothetical protein